MSVFECAQTERGEVSFDRVLERLDGLEEAAEEGSIGADAPQVANRDGAGQDAFVVHDGQSRHFAVAHLDEGILQRKQEQDKIINGFSPAIEV